jgi:hypothetical protein
MSRRDRPPLVDAAIVCVVACLAWAAILTLVLG